MKMNHIFQSVKFIFISLSCGKNAWKYFTWQWITNKEEKKQQVGPNNI
jgi:hypothetical protein